MWTREPLFWLIFATSVPWAAAVAGGSLVSRATRVRTYVAGWLLWAGLTILWISILLPSRESTSSPRVPAGLDWGIYLAVGGGSLWMLWTAFTRKPAPDPPQGFEVIRK